jgi:uncharacterized membrane protein YdbT with pleckstrin-like domain
MSQWNPIDQLNREEELRQRKPHYLFIAFTVLAIPALIACIHFGEWIDAIITVGLQRMGREGQIALGWTIVAMALALLVRREIKRS